MNMLFHFQIFDEFQNYMKIFEIGFQNYLIKKKILILNMLAEYCRMTELPLDKLSYKSLICDRINNINYVIQSIKYL